MHFCYQEKSFKRNLKPVFGPTKKSQNQMDSTQKRFNLETLMKSMPIAQCKKSFHISNTTEDFSLKALVWRIWDWITMQRPKIFRQLGWRQKHWVLWITESLDDWITGWLGHWMTESLDEWVTGWPSHWMTESLDDRVTERPTSDTYWHLLTPTDTYWHLLTVTDIYWHLLTPTYTYWHLLTTYHS